MTQDQIPYLYYLYLIQAYFTCRYVVKAVFGLAPNYTFVKLLLVVFVPVAGYFMAMKEPDEVF